MAIDSFTQPDWQRCCLLTIDLQNDTMNGQPLEVPGTDEVVPAVTELLRLFRLQQRPIAHLVRLYKADGTNADLCRRSKVLSGEMIFRPGSHGSELPSVLFPEGFTLDHQRLLGGNLQAVSAYEVMIYKPRWGGFYQTGLESWLLEKNVNTLILTGCNFPNCPRTTIYEASERDFKLALVTEALSGLYPEGSGK